ncbi:MAG TPA: hypothetical protein VM925_25995 [Labilithrix sp.]|nr:hypothetical protein [Labilithrix sp.]
MRTHLLCAAALALVGCGQTTTTFVKSDTTLGRVVVYRNGVAYFERYAEVRGDSLKLNVPHDKVDDFLKSLTVVDATTGEPAPISYPSTPAGGGTIDMKVGVGTTPGTHKLRLSYVTEAPSWKPSYRVVVGKTGKVDSRDGRSSTTPPAKTGRTSASASGRARRCRSASTSRGSASSSARRSRTTICSRRRRRWAEERTGTSMVRRAAIVSSAT